MKIFEYLKDKNILILGFGKQGRSTYKYIRKHFPTKFITISDKNINVDTKELNNDRNVKMILGEKYLENVDNYDLIIKAPGVILKNIERNNIEERITTDYELFLRFLKCKKIGITGTKGKSTTSTLIYNILKANGKKAFLIGNIGTPIFDLIDEICEEDYAVIEVSSHMLEFVKYSPDIAILLNIFPEHLDHCNGLDDYIDLKYNIARFQENDDYFIFNAESDLMKNRMFESNGNEIAIALSEINYKNKVYLKNGNIYLNDKFLMNSNETMKIKGKHMLNNMMFVLAVSEILNLNLSETIRAIKETAPLKHRMEYVGKYNEIEFYDDVIATIPEATINCIKTLKNVNTLICGGTDRGVNQIELVQFLKKSDVENVICMPDTGFQIYKELIGIKNVYMVYGMQEAVYIAKNVTKKNMICLLSPAASSYNMYNNFEEKGCIFQKYIKMT